MLRSSIQLTVVKSFITLLVVAVIGLLVAVVGQQSVYGFADDPADNPANTVIDANCAPAPADCAAEISDVINDVTARPLKVTFGANHPPLTQFAFNSNIRIESNISIVGENFPIVQMHTAKPFLPFSDFDNVSIRDFEVDLMGCDVFDTFIDIQYNFSNLHLSNLNLYNGNSYDLDPSSCTFVRSNGTSSHLYVSEVTADRMTRFIWLRPDSYHVDVEVLNNLVNEVEHSAFISDSFVENVRIEANEFTKHSPNARAGHMIGFQMTKNASNITYAVNVTIKDNYVTGRPDTPHLRVDGVTFPTGGSADLIALRGTDGFLVEDNTILNSGEVGLTATAGIRNGIIRNNIISDTDFTGIAFGNALSDNAPVVNVDVYGNTVSGAGKDQSDRHPSWTFPAMNIWNVQDSCVVNNRFINNPEAMGLWIFDGTHPAWQPSVFNIYVADNFYSGNGYGNLMQSGHPGNGYTPTTNAGADFWTSTYPGVDYDGDGFGTVCSSETNDNDPCQPFEYAPACENPTDNDNDGVLNQNDLCPFSIDAQAVNANGCTDADADSYFVDALASDPNHDPNDTDVCIPNINHLPSCDTDQDDDGVDDAIDQCPFSTGINVDEFGCTDSDGDGYHPDVDISATDFDEDDQNACIPDASLSVCLEQPESIITIRAKGETGRERMKLSLNNSLVATWSDVDDSDFNDYTFSVIDTTVVNELKVRFTNKGRIQGVWKQLHVDYIDIDGVRYEAEDAATLMSGSVANDSNSCQPLGYQQNDTLQCNGHFSFEQAHGTTLADDAISGNNNSSVGSCEDPTSVACVSPEPQVGDSTIIIRARGATGTERMKLSINGSYVETWDNVSQDFVEYVYTAISPLIVNEIKVHFTNKGKVQSVWKQLEVDYIDVAGTRYETEAASTLMAGSVIAGSTSCQTQGFHRNYVLQCNGWFKYAVPAATQL